MVTEVALGSVAAPERVSLKQTFLEMTGYCDADVLAWNFSTRKFLTRNGGVYILTEQGHIKHLEGPSPDPSDRL
jgi:hypothetical protein